MPSLREVLVIWTASKIVVVNHLLVSGCCFKHHRGFHNFTSIVGTCDCGEVVGRIGWVPKLICGEATGFMLAEGGLIFASLGSGRCRLIIFGHAGTNDEVFSLFNLVS